ncbi:MAG: peptide chain release factor N(5)-glutamine methyltransferase [Bacillota bacterium]
MTLIEAYTEACGFLSGHGIQSAALDAGLLVAKAAGVSRYHIYTHPEEEMDAPALERLRMDIRRRAAGLPIAYLTGIREFMSLEFRVNESVLIPRPETEILVETMLSELGRGALVVDVGTGSGCVAVSLAVLRPDVRVLAVDISEPALKTAEENVVLHGVSERVAVLLSDLLSGVSYDEGFDAVAANLPYIPTGEMERLPAGVQYEPALALDGGPDGLSLIRRLLPQAYRCLKPGGRVYLEVGASQAESVILLAGEMGFTEPRSIMDLQGIERVVCCRKTLR